jgi:hypothetical protein
MDISNLTENILRRMPANLTQIEQARYIYLQLGKLFTFDEKYWLGNSKTRKMIYKSARKIHTPKDLKSNKVICVSLTNTYNGLLQRMGIEAEAVHAEDDLHVYSIFKIDGVEYEADLQRDMKFIQAHRKTRLFGREPDYSTRKLISDEQMQEMDEKFGYTYEGDENLYILINRLKEKLKQFSSVGKKTEYALKQIGQFEEDSDMGFVEKMLYYEMILPDVLNEKEAKKIQIMDMYVENDGERKYTCCISANNEKNSYERFIYSEKTGTFLPIDERDLIKLMDEGLRTVGNKKIRGLTKSTKIEVDKNR